MQQAVSAAAASCQLCDHCWLIEHLTVHGGRVQTMSVEYFAYIWILVYGREAELSSAEASIHTILSVIPLALLWAWQLVLLPCCG
jgi:hypothetical protein